MIYRDLFPASPRSVFNAKAGPDEADRAYGLAKLAVPHHFATFPGITATTDTFASELRRPRIRFHEMKPGETLVFRGKQRIAR
jgi:L-ascorbate metabolism protein UlaG (beta-lactamase superfamily)